LIVSMLMSFSPFFNLLLFSHKATDHLQAGYPLPRQLLSEAFG